MFVRDVGDMTFRENPAGAVLSFYACRASFKAVDPSVCIYLEVLRVHRLVSSRSQSWTGGRYCSNYVVRDIALCLGIAVGLLMEENLCRGA